MSDNDWRQNLKLPPTGQLSFESFVEEQKNGAPPIEKGDLTGKTVMITGANSGIGYEAAKHFASMNPARLILVCRSVEKAQESIKQLEAEIGYTHAEPMSLDLGSFSSITKAATQAMDTLDRLDILVENAGLYDPRSYVQTEDGWENMLQVNALGPALHTMLLLPLIEKTAKQYSVTPRIVEVSSEIILFSKIDGDAVAAMNTLEVFSSKEYCTPTIMEKVRYNESKLISFMLVRKLAKLLPKNIVPVATTPGYCVSGLRRHEEGEKAAWFKQMEDEFGFTSEEGSRQLIYAAIGGKDEELRGAFTGFSRVIEPSDWMLSKEGKKAEDKIWSEMLELFGKVDSRIPSIVSEHLKA